MTATVEQDAPAAEPEAGIQISQPITASGIYDITETEYHSDPVPGGSLSSSTARKLLAECPAVVEYERTHPVAHKDAWDLGSLMHKLVLGKGGQFQVIERETWNTNAVKEEVAAVRAAGRTPIKASAMRAAEAMADAVRRHTDAGPLFAEGTGLAERSIFWTHERTGTALRSMLDWLCLADRLPPLIVDLKSTKDVSKRGVAKAVAEYRYYQQDPFYRAAVASLGFDLADIGFVFVFVGSAPPHLVTVAVLDDEALAEGMACNEEAIDLWVQCQDTGIWPPYATDIETISLPAWALKH